MDLNFNKDEQSVVNRVCLKYGIDATDPLFGVLQALVELNRARNAMIGPEFFETMKTLASNADAFSETIETQKSVAQTYSEQLQWLNRYRKVVLVTAITLAGFVLCPISYFIGKGSNNSVIKKALPGLKESSGVDNQERRFVSLQSGEITQVTRSGDEVTLYLRKK